MRCVCFVAPFVLSFSVPLPLSRVFRGVREEQHTRIRKGCMHACLRVHVHTSKRGTTGRYLHTYFEVYLEVRLYLPGIIHICYFLPPPQHLRPSSRFVCAVSDPPVLPAPFSVS
ncbi:unnamed protein product [Pylaiella littoralis]